MNKILNKRVGILGLVLFVLVFSSGCTGTSNQSAQKSYKPVTLVYWSVWNDEDSIVPLIEKYRKTRPNVSIEYRKKRFETYEQDLLEAMADDRGPDVFSIHNTWVPKYKSKLLAMPSKTVVPIRYTQGNYKKEEVYTFVTKNSLTPLDVSKKFLDQVGEDVILSGGIYGLPLSMDTLVLFYNKDILKNAGIVEPATNWSDFQENVQKMTKIDAQSNEILLSGAALGTADNIPRNFDILSLLMMQNMAPMLDSKGLASFHKKPAELADIPSVPANGALEYYVQFASPLYESYSWNTSMLDALDSFKDGKLGYFFGYSYNRDFLKASAPQLDFDIAPVPQVGEQQKVNYASYWVESVSKKTENQNYSWEFVQFMANEANVVDYLSIANKPTALQSTKIINEQLQNPDLIVFADQLLTAKSWFRGNNPAAAEDAFDQMIQSVLSGEANTTSAIKRAVAMVNLAITGR